jgi:uncharacterized protein YndB with AHSA1/START domain
MTTRTAEHGTFVITRTYSPAPRRVFAAWASQEAKARWFGSPPSEVNDNLRLDFRIGGSETLSGGPPDGPVHTYVATYQDIVPNQRIVYDYIMKADADLISVSVATVEFAAAGGGGTTLTFTEQGVFLDGKDNPAVREKGTSELLDQLGSALS